MKRRQWFYIVYVLIGATAAVLVLIQLMLGDVIGIYGDKNIIKNTTKVDSGKPIENVVVEDKYKDIITALPTYTDLNGVLNRQIGTKLNIIAAGNSSTKDTIPVTTADKSATTVKPTGKTGTQGSSKPVTTNKKQYTTLSGLSKLASETFKNIELSMPLDINTYTIGNQFGDVITNKEGFKEFNMGVELLTPIDGENVYASLNGKVTYVGDEKDGLGLKTIIKNDLTGLSFIYASLKACNVVVGDAVNTNDVIGQTGGNAYSKTSHLHLEIFDTASDTRYDPEKFSYK